MFTTIMYGFINEVTRQPASVEIPLRGKRADKPERAIKRPPPKTPQVATATRRERCRWPLGSPVLKFAEANARCRARGRRKYHQGSL